MVDGADYDFEKTDAGSLMVDKVSAGSLKVGGLVMIKDHPCKITSYSTAKTGKHGAAKAMLTGIDILTNNKYECTYSTGDTVDAPIAKRIEYNLINVDEDDFCTLLMDSGEIKEDLKIPEEDHLKETAKRIREIFEAGTKECIVTVLSTLGKEQIINAREGKDQ